MDKPFKTYDELLDFLESKKILVMKFNKINEEREQANDRSALERQLKRQ
ncbi:MAG: hypothetical protein J6P79_02425 [Pseudobutyrivibrio sp.]|nr:hypothetical protein [Pseudobutyrivibrio sp.]